MPLYEYQCAKCGKVFEKIQKFSDPPVVIHEECGGVVERLISAPAFHLKGSGWYATDYAKTSASKPDAKSNDSKSEGKEDSKTESKSDSSSESKAAETETKTESKPVAPAAKTE